MKIKLLLICLVSFFTVMVKAQAPVDSLHNKVADSIQVKLQQYKQLFDAGVIGEDEYNKKKAELLGTPVTTPANIHVSPNDSTQVKRKIKSDVVSDVILTKADTMPLNALKDRYKSRVVAGSVILSVGTGFLLGDVLLATLSPKLVKTDSLYAEKASTRRGSEIALGVLGGVAGIGGSVFLALGLKDKAIYKRRGKELTINFNGKEIEFAFVF